MTIWIFGAFCFSGFAFLKFTIAREAGSNGIADPNPSSLLLSSFCVPYYLTMMQDTRQAFAYIALFYLVQPLAVHYAVLGQPLLYRLGYFLLFLTVLLHLATHLRACLGEDYSFNINLLWWPFALLVIKLFHTVVDVHFRQTFGLTKIGYSL